MSSISRAGGAISVQTISINTGSMVLFDSNAAVAGVGILDGYRNGTTGAIMPCSRPFPPLLTSPLASINISALTDSTADLATLDGYIKGADRAITEMAAGATALGAAKARIEIQTSFVSSLMDAIEGGISQLVDADMNEELTRLQALQVKQQLGIQALSIANGSSQSILRLFQ